MFLKVANLTKSFRVGKQVITAVDNVDLIIEQGEVFGLVGQSGCGKSTLSKMILQLLPPSAGNIWLDGLELGALRGRQLRQTRLDFQMVFQDPYASLNPRLTIQQTLLEALLVRSWLTDAMPPKDSKRAVVELLDLVGMPTTALDKYPHEFSGGQRQRIAIARAIAPKPKLIVADEPVSALDVSIQSQIINLFKQLQKELKLTCLFISHDLALVHYIANRIAVMKSGRIIECAEATQLFEKPEHAYTRNLLEATKLSEIKS